MIQTTDHSPGALILRKIHLSLMGKRFRKAYAEKEAKNIPWKAKGAEIIVECTGFYTRREIAGASYAGAKKVLISAPAGEMKTIVYNVNDAYRMATTPLFPCHAPLTVLRRWPKPCMTVSG